MIGLCNPGDDLIRISVSKPISWNELLSTGLLNQKCSVYDFSKVIDRGNLKASRKIGYYKFITGFIISPHWVISSWNPHGFSSSVGHWFIFYGSLYLPLVLWPCTNWLTAHTVGWLKPWITRSQIIRTGLHCDQSICLKLFVKCARRLRIISSIK